MSVRSSISAFARRMPFGIGASVGVLSVVLVVIAGAVLAISPPTVADDHGFGLLRDYRTDPREAWTLTDLDLPGYRDAGDIRVDGSAGDTWLVSYPTGIGRSVVAVDRTDGRLLWEHPVDVGLGDCAITTSRKVGCAIRLSNSLEDGFYLLGADGTPADALPRQDTARVYAAGDDFLRINDSSTQVMVTTASGKTRWTPRTFAPAVAVNEVVVTNREVIIPTTDGGTYLVDRDNGEDRLSCTRCTMAAFVDGIAVQYDESGHERVDTHRYAGNGAVDPDPTSSTTNVHLIDGPSVRPVITANNSVLATFGTYTIVDPADGKSWRIGQAEVSKGNARPCGGLLSLAHIDRSRVTFALDDDLTRVGAAPVPEPGDAGVDLDKFRCVGSSDTTIVVSGLGQLAAVTADGQVAWQQNLVGGTVAVVDGYVTVARGSTLTLLE